MNDADELAAGIRDLALETGISDFPDRRARLEELLGRLAERRRGRLPLIGRDFALVRSLAKQIRSKGTAGHAITGLSDYGEDGRGFHFEVMVFEGGKSTGRVARVQVTLDRVEQVTT